MAPKKSQKPKGPTLEEKTEMLFQEMLRSGESRSAFRTLPSRPKAPRRYECRAPD